MSTRIHLLCVSSEPACQSGTARISVRAWHALVEALLKNQGIPPKWLKARARAHHVRLKSNFRHHTGQIQKPPLAQDASGAMLTGATGMACTARLRLLSELISLLQQSNVRIREKSNCH